MAIRNFDGFMRGVNLGGWLSQCKHEDEQHKDIFITEKDLEIIAGWGADHVRLPVDYEIIELYGYKYIDLCAKWCEKYGLNIIFDIHKTEGYAFYNLETNALFDDRKLQLKFIDMWKKIADRYKNLKVKIAFELLNEIVEPDSKRWNKLAAEAIAAIREIAPLTPIIVGGIQYNSVHTLNQLESIADVSDENIVYTFHFYEPFLFTHQGAKWVKKIDKITGMKYPDDIETYRKISKDIGCFGSGLFENDNIGADFFCNMFLPAIEAADKANVGLYCGEYGVISNADLDSTINWYENMSIAFKRHNIGRACWSYKGMSFGVADYNSDKLVNAAIKL